MACKARQYSDQMSCVCGLSWDKGDPYPPECRGAPQVQKAQMQPVKVEPQPKPAESSKPAADYISELMSILDD